MTLAKKNSYRRPGSRASRQQANGIPTDGRHPRESRRDKSAGMDWSELEGAAMAYPAVDSWGGAMDFRVDLTMFRGPLDLLLYLVKKHELDIAAIPIATITDQYLAHLEVLEQLDVDSVGDFIEVASLLIEIKSKLALPQVDETDEVPLVEDPRQELVQRLLEYKQYKDAASMLYESSHVWQQRYTRLANDLPERQIDPAAQPIHEVELWDLVSAMGRIMRESQQTQTIPSIVYDDTPIHVHMRKIHSLLVQDQRVSFSSMFQPGMPKTRLIGIFLAVLELTRNYGVQAEQDDLYSDIYLVPGESFQPQLEISDVFHSDFETSESVPPAKPR